MRKIILAILISFLFFSCGNSQEKKSKSAETKDSAAITPQLNYAVFSDEDRQIVEKIFAKAKENQWQTKDLGEIVLLVGKEFIGTEYVGGVLDQNKTEMLVVNLKALDCVTFVENTNAIASCIKQEQYSFGSFLSRLKSLRYRNGTINSYSSRLHYFSDWLYENEKSGNIKRLSQKIADTPKEIEVFFMSRNAGKYPLLSSEELISEMAEKEKEISSRKYFYINENEIDNYKNKISNGAIVGITTKINGLDITHTGLAIHVNDKLCFMHASSLSGKVEITDISLQEMLLKSKNNTGIMLAKLIK